MSDLCKDGTVPQYGAGPFVCSSCGTVLTIEASIPDRDPHWFPIGNRRVCRDVKACFRAYIKS